MRLSRDDFRATKGFAAGDSYSIVNQKKLLTKVAKEKGHTNLLTYCDDGASGVTMERPGYKQIISYIENNNEPRRQQKPGRGRGSGSGCQTYFQHDFSRFCALRKTRGCTAPALLGGTP